MSSLAKSTIIEGVASTSHRDVQGEVLDLNGADISPLLEGRGFVNSDHSGRFEHLVGRVVGAKKVMALSDCETPEQIKYWSEQKRPFLWTKIELWDGHGHKEADAISSIYNFYKDKNEISPVKLSVEGKTLERGTNGLLKRTVIKGVALTVHPANRATRTDVVSVVKSLGAPESLVKSESDIVPIFIETQSNPLENILHLVMNARDLMKSVNERDYELECQKALKKLKVLLGK
jgi:hypothetical protein